MATIFSKIAAHEIPSYTIAENEEFFAFLDINPIAKGHTLVIPKQEIDYLFDIDDNVLQRYIVFAKKVAIAIREAIPCKRVGMTVMGLEVPHAHIHLIPMDGEGDMNFSKKKLSLTPEEFTSIAENISKKLNF